MCGLAGLVDLDGGAVDAAPVHRMLGSLAHRGPDGRGIEVDRGMVLGHLRLSILDPTPAGAQPMCRGRNVLVHNGEVYNYLELADELRARGRQISSATDTEVILAAYDEWGIDAVRRFNGMFAFALWDGARRRLVLARDRMGVKPLYLRQTAHSLAFASEVAAFVSARPLDPSDDWTPEPDLAVVRDFLSRGLTDHSARTFLAGVTALPPGHLLVAEDGAARVVRYWGPPALADDDRPARPNDRVTDRRAVDEFRDVFDSSVRLRLRSDVPLGTCLSGGLDSSSIVATVAEQVARDGAGRGTHEQLPRLAFHARFPDDGIDESAFAALVAGANGVRLVTRTPSARPLLPVVLRVLAAQGEPYGGASVVAQHAVMAAAHDEGLKVLLDGQGADELLGGYVHYGGVRATGLLAGGRPIAAVRELIGQVRRSTVSPGTAIASLGRAALPDALLEGIRGASGGRLGLRCAGALASQPRLDEPVREPGTFLARRLWRAMTTGLPALLRYEDRNSMAFGIEARVPFLDVRLIELAVRLPDRLRFEQGVTKAVLRRAMAGRLPPAILRRRDKLGFSAPEQAWLTAAHDELAPLLRGGQLVERGWVEPSEVERVLAAGGHGRRHVEQLWRLAMTEAWLRATWPRPADRTLADWLASVRPGGQTGPTPTREPATPLGRRT